MELVFQVALGIVIGGIALVWVLANFEAVVSFLKAGLTVAFAILFALILVIKAFG